MGETGRGAWHGHHVNGVQVGQSGKQGGTTRVPHHHGMGGAGGDAAQAPHKCGADKAGQRAQHKHHVLGVGRVGRDGKQCGTSAAFMECMQGGARGVVRAPRK
ncbi:hypothetical protein R1flu_024759 [Riccia fluitans]|uniref:Uncharacterized protein n=1 Tax=Riccia fluitans TaxID=41844 RepID=A0ABD1XVU7_9MARC